MIEIDDSVDSSKDTTVPSSLIGRELTEAKQRDHTTIPDHDVEVQETAAADEEHTAPIALGRTWPDLISEYVNSPQVMATILMGFPLAVYLIRIKAIADFKYPVVVGLILILFWFGVPLLIWFVRSAWLLFSRWSGK